MMELLAPAGDFEGMEGAIGAGADAVYAGGAMFGARAYAKNFSQEELLEAIDYVHVRGKKLYLTVNTLLKSKEIKKDLYRYLAPFYERGLDAVIVQDIGVLSWIRRQFPELALHASTQMTVTGPKGMRFLEANGVKRVVAARELSLTELEQMRKESPLEIEAFVHGALCYCYSGQCLFSSILGGRSGNRGRCAQPCRLPYEYVEGTGKKLHLLSPKDMCAIELLPEIARAGVTSLKIEGRMKQPGYTAGVVAVYRKYLDLLERDGAAGYQVDQKDKEALLELFSRGGSHPGYFKQHNGPSMMAFVSDKKIGNQYPEIIKNKEKVKGNLILFAGSPAILEMSYAGKSVHLEEGLVQEAKNQPMTKERVRRQMEKMNETPFRFESLEIQMGDSIFVPVKVLNELRRNAVAALTEELLAPHRRPFIEKLADLGEKRAADVQPKAMFFSASCETKDQLLACLETGQIRRLYVPLELVDFCLDSKAAKGKELYAAMPHIVRDKDLLAYESKAEQWLGRGLQGFLVRNLETYGWLKEQGWNQKCLLDASLYTWNDEAQEFWQQEGVLGDTVPLELNHKELSHRDNHDSEMLVYGYLPLMVSAQCVPRNLEGCRKKTGIVHIKDRYQKEFPVKHYCEFCYNVIYNSLPYGLPGEREAVRLLGVRSVRLSFTLESGRETRQVLQEFCDSHTVTKESAYTKGHWNRGAQ
ncbi:MAG: DUF3656 domain-containing U32 family peptidase [Blautia sp.]|jgi:putative protease